MDGNSGAARGIFKSAGYRSVILRVGGKQNRENTPFPEFALYINEPVHGIQKSFYDGESKTSAGDISSFIVFDSVESFKNLVQIFIGDAEAVVLHLYSDVDAGHFNLDVDFSTVLRVIDGIGDQVAKNAFQGNGVGGEFGKRVLWEFQA